MIREFPNGRSLQLLKGDITKVPVDAMANAANSELKGGGGVDGAIHAAGGPVILAALDVIRAEQGGCPVGGAVATTAGSLPATWVFHAVGPIYENGAQGEGEQLASAYRACLSLAEEKGIGYLSFPSISTGAFGFPVREAAPVAVKEVVEHLRRDDTKLQKVLFVLADDQTLAIYGQALRSLVPAEN